MASGMVSGYSVFTFLQWSHLLLSFSKGNIRLIYMHVCVYVLFCFWKAKKRGFWVGAEPKNFRDRRNVEGGSKGFGWNYRQHVSDLLRPSCSVFRNSPRTILSPVSLGPQGFPPQIYFYIFQIIFSFICCDRQNSKMVSKIYTSCCPTLYNLLPLNVSGTY